jgi:hypothetical protein
MRGKAVKLGLIPEGLRGVSLAGATEMAQSRPLWATNMPWCLRAVRTILTSIFQGFGGGIGSRLQ